MALPTDQIRIPWPRVFAIAIAQVVSWGTVYYSFTLFLGPMQAELNWSKADLSAGFSLAMIVGAISAMFTGRWIDRFGGRGIMATGSLLAFVLLLLWSQVANLTLYYLIWAAFGLVLATTLYDPAFMVLVIGLREKAPQAIMAVTLVAGLAGTVFVPLTNVLIDTYGWRTALVFLAAANLAIAVPIHLVALNGLHRHSGADETQAASPDERSPVGAVLRRPVFWAILATFFCHAAFYSSVPVHFIPLLIDNAVEKDLAVTMFALIGPSQVAGRAFMALIQRWVPLRYSGLLAFAFCLFGFAVLSSGSYTMASVAMFAILYGAANGMITIVRATIVPELLGRRGIGAIQGTITFPVSLLLAAAPYLTSLIEQQTGSYAAVIQVWLVVSALAFISLAAALWLGRASNWD